jgi:hypothetical protein
MLKWCRCYRFDDIIFEVDLPVFDISYFPRIFEVFPPSQQIYDECGESPFKVLYLFLAGYKLMSLNQSCQTKKPFEGHTLSSEIQKGAFGPQLKKILYFFCFSVLFLV